MNRINQLFKEKQQGIRSTYFCAGYPQLDSTVPTLQALQKGGIDLVEIGVPFSDPMADGRVVQDASSQALKNGITLQTIFDQLKDIRKTVNMPLILMGYLNVFYQYGFEKFCQSCKECGIDGAIIPDLPFDIYVQQYKPIADQYDIKIVMLITPETSEERIRMIDEQTNGFIYEVSTDATTGAQESYGEETLKYFKRIQNMKLKNPTLIGFGISNKKTFEAAQQYAAGTIVGSKFVKLSAACDTPEEAVAALNQALKE